MGALGSPDWDLPPGTIGPLESCISLKLVPVPSIVPNPSNPGTPSNKPPVRASPSGTDSSVSSVSTGEIYLRGPSIALGYLSRPSETAETFLDGGWLRTGDIGQVDERGHLRIIDRRKNLVKTLRGEYVALEKVPPESPGPPCPSFVCAVVVAVGLRLRVLLVVLCCLG